MAGDACAFLAERLLGDLNDHVLPGLQHFGNQLWPARWSGMTALIPTVMPWAAGTAFESRPAWASSTIGTSATTVGASTAAIRAPAAVVAATIPAAAAERPLEARARVAADTGGTARELFARGAGTTDARRTGFAWKKNHVFFDDRSLRNNSAGHGGNRFLFDVLRFARAGSGVLFLVFLLVFVFAFLRVLGFSVLVFANVGRMDGAVVRKVRFSFGAVDGALFFDIFRFFRREFRVLRRADGFRLACFFFCLFFFELGAADDGIRFRFFLGLFVFSLDEARCERGDLILVQFDLATHRFGFENRALGGGSLFQGGCTLTRGRCFAFGAAIGQQPAGKAAREPAGNVGAAWSGGECHVASCPRRNFLRSRLLIMRLVLNRWRRCRRGLAAIFCERFAGKNDGLLVGVYRSRGTGAARGVLTPVVVPAWLASAIVVAARFTALRRSVF